MELIQKKILFSIAISFAILLSSCAVVDNQFCKQSGYLSGTYGYYDCVNRYNEDTTAFKYCAEIYNLNKESPKQEQCVKEKIPAIKKTFEIDKNKCIYESETIFTINDMYPLTSTEIRENNFNGEILNTKTFSKNKSGNREAIDFLVEKRKNYVDICLKEKGWGKSLQFLKYDFNGLNWKNILE